MIKNFFQKLNPIFQNYMKKIQYNIFLIKKIYLLVKKLDITKNIKIFNNKK